MNVSVNTSTEKDTAARIETIAAFVFGAMLFGEMAWSLVAMWFGGFPVDPIHTIESAGLWCLTGMVFLAAGGLLLKNDYRGHSALILGGFIVWLSLLDLRIIHERQLLTFYSSEYRNALGGILPFVTSAYFLISSGMVLLSLATPIYCRKLLPSLEIADWQCHTMPAVLALGTFGYLVLEYLAG